MTKKPKNNELEELKAKCEEYLNGWKRAQADYQNLEKRTAESVQKTVEMVNSGLVEKLLPIIDSFELAFAHIPKEEEEKEWVAGIYQIKKQFDDLLKAMEIEKIKSKNVKFDPSIHEAIASEESDKESGEILKEVQAGYRIKDKIIRPARVVVGK